ncbi:MAG: metal ABC transporter ATP-binding protein [Spirochaetaceae bacterium]|nr:metal ABC transporter ATP-binding protein [Spirochaetaceae bacterium]
MRIHGRESPHEPGTALLDIEAVSAGYDGRSALEAVSMQVTAGQRIAVVGPNGAGKSSLFKVVAGVHRPATGTVRVYGSDPGGHVCLAYIEQSADLNWRFPAMVEDVVAMGRIARVGYFRRLRRPDRAIVAAAMERVAITPLRRRQIGELSGGQRQRMFIARALAQQAELLMLDEPFAGLDADASRQLEATLDALGDTVTVLLATHDLGVAERMGRVALLNRRLIGCGPASEVLVADRLALAYGSNVLRIDRDGSRFALPDSHCDHGHPAEAAEPVRTHALP